MSTEIGTTQLSTFYILQYFETAVIMKDNNYRTMKLTLAA